MSIFFERNEKGELIGKEFVIEGEKFILRPMMRGEWAELDTMTDKDKAMIDKCLISPKISEEDFKFIKPAFSKAIINKIVEISDLTFKKEKQSDELKKP